MGFFRQIKSWKLKGFPSAQTMVAPPYPENFDISNYKEIDIKLSSWLEVGVKMSCPQNTLATIFFISKYLQGNESEKNFQLSFIFDKLRPKKLNLRKSNSKNGFWGLYLHLAILLMLLGHLPWCFYMSKWSMIVVSQFLMVLTIDIFGFWPSKSHIFGKSE